MPIPTSRSELVKMVESSFGKLNDELNRAGAEIGDLPCVDDWSVKDLLTVRAWWTASVVEWIEAGRRGAKLDLPATGYSWRETPRLNSAIVSNARPETYEDVLARLRTAYTGVLKTIDELNDHELLEAEVFEWAGKWPLARWISMNTARQYTTARALIRGSLRRRQVS